jgi:uncharacterized RDD family membrane protein YckC
LIRNLLLPLFGIIDLAIMLNHGTRGGDRLARTLVVKAEYLNKPPL